ncbi:MAG: hypothetical protein K2Y32_10275 [Candidatus Obscuribacterales bacterium]|nr:hypothetical protein [Candidatus Obscuribacterales bacterium]
MLTLEQACGKLLVARLPGLSLTEPDDRLMSMLKKGTAGGATLFKENCRDLEQLNKLCTNIIEASFHTPVLTVDQEGGAVQRFEDALSPFPSPMALWALGEEAIRQAQAVAAGQLSKLGFNLLLAPTLDLQTNRLNPIIATRAFSDNVEAVTRAGRAALQAIEAQGLRACGKHFPGHGSTSEDSHLTLPSVDKDKETLFQTDFAPFINLKDELSCILVGHIWFPQYDQEVKPSSLSNKLVSQVLQQQIGYKGLLVSDDMLMKGLTVNLGLSEACVQAIEAGLDLLLVLGTAEQLADAHKELVHAVKSGRISESRIQASVNKIAILFRRGSPLPQQELASFSSKVRQDTESMLELSSRAIVHYKGEPMAPNQLIDSVVIAPAHKRYKLDLARELKRELKRDLAAGLSEYRYELSGDLEFAGLLEELTKTRRTVIFLSYRSFIKDHSKQIAMLENLKAAGLPLIHIAIDSPYDLLLTKDSATTSSYALMDPSDLAIKAMARVLTGQVQPQGSLPLSIGE